MWNAIGAREQCVSSTADCEATAPRSERACKRDFDTKCQTQNKLMRRRAPESYHAQDWSEC